MTDTSTEAVARLAHQMDNLGFGDVFELIHALAAERDALEAEVEQLQASNELMCAQLDSLPPPEPGLLKRQLRKVADKRARAAIRAEAGD